MPQGTQHAAKCPKHAPETPIHTTTRILHTQPGRLRLTYLPQGIPAGCGAGQRGLRPP